MPLEKKIVSYTESFSNFLQLAFLSFFFFFFAFDPIKMAQPEIVCTCLVRRENAPL